MANQIDISDKLVPSKVLEIDGLLVRIMGTMNSDIEAAIQEPSYVFCSSEGEYAIGMGDLTQLHFDKDHVPTIVFTIEGRGSPNYSDCTLLKYITDTELAKKVAIEANQRLKIYD